MQLLAQMDEYKSTFWEKYYGSIQNRLHNDLETEDVVQFDTKRGKIWRDATAFQDLTHSILQGQKIPPNDYLS